MANYKHQEYKPGMPIGNYKVRQYKGGGNYIKFGLKDGRNKEPDDAATRKRKAQIYGPYKDPLTNKTHQYNRCHSYQRKPFVSNKEKYNYLYFGGATKVHPYKPQNEDDDTLPPIEKEKTNSSITSHRRTKSDISLPAIAPIVIVSRSSSDVQPDTRKRTRKGNGSFYPQAYAGSGYGLSKQKDYNSGYKYRHNTYKLKDPYSLNGRNYFGFTHSIDKNKPRKRRHSYPRDEEKTEAPKKEEPKKEEPKEEEPVKERTPTPEPAKEPTPVPVRQITPTPTPAPVAAPTFQSPSPEPIIAAAVIGGAAGATAVAVVPQKTPTPEPMKQKTPTPTPSPSPVVPRTPTPVVQQAPPPPMPLPIVVAGAAVGGIAVAAAPAAPKNPTPVPPPPVPEPEIQPVSPSPEPVVGAKPDTPLMAAPPVVAPVMGIAVAAAPAAPPPQAAPPPPPKQEPLRMAKPKAGAGAADKVVLAADVADVESGRGKHGAASSIMKSYANYRFKKK